ncbi:MAG TPA: TetR/AcrR family transcriptional regulator [Thermoanaerobaculia bacterium]|nr:TetR/AcrR family transcriptional regulator [Thermoanaerobaculia bacterium]
MKTRATTEKPPSAGQRTRSAILEHAVDLASVEGLEGLAIGPLASALQMSKSGLFAHFGSKEELQLATIEAARERFINEVFLPSLERKRGLTRLTALSDAWISYAERKVFRGGCFFVAASAEFDSKPGPVRNRIAAVMGEWLGALERAVTLAQESGELDPAVEPSQLAFELNALFMGANWAFQLHRDKSAFVHARVAIEARLGGLELRPKLRVMRKRG